MNVIVNNPSNSFKDKALVLAEYLTSLTGFKYSVQPFFMSFTGGGGPATSFDVLPYKKGQIYFGNILSLVDDGATNTIFQRLNYNNQDIIIPSASGGSFFSNNRQPLSLNDLFFQNMTPVIENNGGAIFFHFSGFKLSPSN